MADIPKDRVFLLSASETNHYADPEKRKKGFATAYRKSSINEVEKTGPAEPAANVEVSKATTSSGKDPEIDTVREISETRATETWYCPNDETANTGSTCVICGCSRRPTTMYSE